MTSVNRYPDCPTPCHECDTADHHWMLDFDDDYPDLPIMRCKHCPATRLVGDNEDSNEPDFMEREASIAFIACPPHDYFPTAVDKDGHPEFRMNRQMSAEPLAHVRCSRCGCRTWLTKAQFAAETVQRE